MPTNVKKSCCLLSVVEFSIIEFMGPRFSCWFVSFFQSHRDVFSKNVLTVGNDEVMSYAIP